MEGFGLTLTLLVLFFANILWCSCVKFNFHRMAYKSEIKITSIRFYFCKTFHYPGQIFEATENVALYKSKYTNETIKVLYPITVDRGDCFQNEIDILNSLSQFLQQKPIENGIVKLINGGDATWKNDDDEKSFFCTVVVYTFGVPLFPILRKCVQNNDRQIFWYFSKMARSMASIKSYIGLFHNNIGPSVFRLTLDGEVIIDNFEIARFRYDNKKRKFIYVSDHGSPIGFKPTMSKKAMYSEKRAGECQRYSFELTSYYILTNKLPWQMDAIEYLWNFNMPEARGITFELRGIDLQDYFISRETLIPVHSKILSVIRKNEENYSAMSAQFSRMLDEFPNP